MTDEYIRRATIVRWIDGDTVRLDVDLGYRTSRTVTIRTLGIDTPEIRGPERPQGLLAKAFCDERWPVGSQIYVKSLRDKKSFDRWLGDLFDSEGVSVADELVKAGFAT